MTTEPEARVISQGVLFASIFAIMLAIAVVFFITSLIDNSNSTDPMPAPSASETVA